MRLGIQEGCSQETDSVAAPRQMFCFVLEYKSYVCLYTAHDIFQIDGDIPKMVVLCETADISSFCEFGFWDWVSYGTKVLLFLTTN